jgi:hypothetical protein
LRFPRRTRHKRRTFDGIAAKLDIHLFTVAPRR